MITKQNLPAGYEPYEKVKICSNYLGGETFILAVDDVLPILVGKGNKPQIWIQAISDVATKSFVQLVEASIPLFPFVRVIAEDGVISVIFNGQKIISMQPQDDGVIDIFQMDFSPIGFNIVGDSNHLRAGGIEFSSSTFSGVGTFIGFTL